MTKPTSSLQTRLPDVEAEFWDAPGWHFASERGEANLPEDCTAAELEALIDEFESYGQPYTVEFCAP